jgi:hypothetical protein
VDITNSVTVDALISAPAPPALRIMTDRFERRRDDRGASGGRQGRVGALRLASIAITKIINAAGEAEGNRQRC